MFCYDNDVDGKDARGQPHNHGQVQAGLSAEAFATAGYKVYIQTSQGKDFNEDLMVFRGMMEQKQGSFSMGEVEPECL